MDSDCAAGNYTRYIPYERLMELYCTWCKDQGIRMRYPYGNREQHTRKVLEDLGYDIQTLTLPFNENGRARQGFFVLGVEDSMGPLPLPDNWRTQLATAPTLRRS